MPWLSLYLGMPWSVGAEHLQYFGRRGSAVSSGAARGPSEKGGMVRHLNESCLGLALAASLTLAGCSPRGPEPVGGAAPASSSSAAPPLAADSGARTTTEGAAPATPAPQPPPVVPGGHDGSRHIGYRLRSVRCGHQDGDLPSRLRPLRVQRVHQRRCDAHGPAGQHQRVELRAERRHAAQRRDRERDGTGTRLGRRSRHPARVHQQGSRGTASGRQGRPSLHRARQRHLPHRVRRPRPRPQRHVALAQGGSGGQGPTFGATPKS